jgi:antitoxin HicB
MKRPDYILALLPDAERGGYTVLVPDLAGCITEGDSFEQALERASEAIEVTLEALHENGTTVPKPSTLESVQKKLDETFRDVVGDAQVIFIGRSVKQTMAS